MGFGRQVDQPAGGAVADGVLSVPIRRRADPALAAGHHQGVKPLDDRFANGNIPAREAFHLVQDDRPDPE